jgi:type IV conjugative transfer system lipoprotein TraV
MWSPKNSKQLFTIGVMVSLSFALMGCGELNSQFTCPMKPGVSCQSLDQVNTLVDQGKLAQAKPASSVEKTTLTVDIRYLADAEDSTDSIKRNPETVMRLWIAPYQDKQGNYFSAHTIYHVIQPGQWSPVTVIPSMDDAHA